MLSKIQVRRAGIADVAEVARLACVGADELPEATDRAARLTTSADRFFALASIEGRAVGVVEAQFWGVALRRGFGSTRLHWIYVEPEWRKRGVASALHEAVLEWCRSIPDCSYLEWQSSPEAVPFYRRMGLVPNAEADYEEFPFFEVSLPGSTPNPR